jgi:hypothetical protein
MEPARDLAQVFQHVRQTLSGPGQLIPEHVLPGFEAFLRRA